MKNWVVGRPPQKRALSYPPHVASLRVLKIYICGVCKRAQMEALSPLKKKGKGLQLAKLFAVQDSLDRKAGKVESQVTNHFAFNQ